MSCFSDTVGIHDEYEYEDEDREYWANRKARLIIYEAGKLHLENNSYVSNPHQPSSFF